MTSERVFLPRPIRWILLAAGSAFLASYALAEVRDLGLWFILTGVVPALCTTVASFCWSRVRVAGTGVEFVWWPLFKRTVDFADIASVEEVELDPQMQGGWGLRKPAGGVVLVNRDGHGIQVTLKNGTFISAVVADPVQLAREITALTAG